VREFNANSCGLRELRLSREKNNSRFLDYAGSPISGRSASLEMTRLKFIRDSLAAEAANEVKQKRQHDAEKERSGEGKVKGGVLAAIEEISGKATERQVGFAYEHEKEAGEDYDSANENQRST